MTKKTHIITQIITFFLLIFPTYSAKTAETPSPFGMQEVRFDKSEEVEAIKDFKVNAARIAPYGALIWDAIERKKGEYDWNASDKVITAGYKSGVELFVTVGCQNRLDNSKSGAGKPTKLPNNLDGFLLFLQKAAERYDGDGIEDAPGSPRIDILQIGNEIDGKMFWEDTAQNYALLLKKSYQVIKKNAENIKVAIAGVATPDGYYRMYQDVLKELDKIKDNPNEQYFDIFDLHWTGQFLGDNDYAVINLPKNKYGLRELVSQIKKDLAEIDYKNISFYITEMSDYSGYPTGYTNHTELYHAAQIVKRYVYSLASGINKIFWTQIVEQHNFAGQKKWIF